MLCARQSLLCAPLVFNHASRQDLIQPHHQSSAMMLVFCIAVPLFLLHCQLEPIKVAVVSILVQALLSPICLVQVMLLSTTAPNSLNSLNPKQYLCKFQIVPAMTKLQQLRMLHKVSIHLHPPAPWINLERTQRRCLLLVLLLLCKTLSNLTVTVIVMEGLLMIVLIAATTNKLGLHLYCLCIIFMNDNCVLAHLFPVFHGYTRQFY